MTLHPIFSSHMVLPAGRELRIFGKGTDTVTVDFAGYIATATPDGDGWIATLPPMPYGGPFCMTVSDRNGRILLDDLYIGEVYLCAGQSNMQFKLGESATPTAEQKGLPLLRLYTTERLESGEHFGPADGWVVCRDSNAHAFSAIGYLVGREISEKKQVAVGLITCYQGASVIESWLPAGTLPPLGICLTREEKHGDHFSPTFLRWNGDGCLYEHHLVKQILPFPVSAVIWYQGESDATPAEAAVYAKELTALIDIWRRAFREPALPFVIVQIADCASRMKDGGWVALQEAQAKVPTVTEGTALVISRDVCETDDIHPKTKDKLAHRIASVLL